jgi:hypothetical protein
MNRSTEFKAGYTLYARHLEERTACARDMLKKLGEEMGQLLVEGIVSWLHDDLRRDAGS